MLPKVAASFCSPSALDAAALLTLMQLSVTACMRKIFGGLAKTLVFFPHSLLVSLSYNLAVSCVAQTIWESDNSAHAVPGLEEQFMEWLLRHKVMNPVNLTDKCMHASVYLAHQSLLIKLYNQKSLPRDQLLYHFYMPVFFGFFDWAIMLYYFILYLLEIYWPPAVMQSSKCHLLAMTWATITWLNLHKCKNKNGRASRDIVDAVVLNKAWTQVMCFETTLEKKERPILRPFSRSLIHSKSHD